MLRIDMLSVSCEIAPMWIPHDPDRLFHSLYLHSPNRRQIAGRYGYARGMIVIVRWKTVEVPFDHVIPESIATEAIPTYM